MARRTANFADPTCQFWLVFAESPFRIFKKVRIILRPKCTNLNFPPPTIYINRLTRKKPETLRMIQTKLFFVNICVEIFYGCSLVCLTAVVYLLFSWFDHFPNLLKVLPAELPMVKAHYISRYLSMDFSTFTIAVYYFAFL